MSNRGIKILVVILLLGLAFALVRPGGETALAGGCPPGQFFSPLSGQCWDCSKASKPEDFAQCNQKPGGGEKGEKKEPEEEFAGKQIYVMEDSKANSAYKVVCQPYDIFEIWQIQPEVRLFLRSKVTNFSGPVGVVNYMLSLDIEYRLTYPAGNTLILDFNTTAGPQTLIVDMQECLQKARVNQNACDEDRIAKLTELLASLRSRSNSLEMNIDLMASLELSALRFRRAGLEERWKNMLANHPLGFPPEDLETWNKLRNQIERVDKEIARLEKELDKEKALRDEIQKKMEDVQSELEKLRAECGNN
ncbi:hypothetical protein D6833_08535 [Candidatus Parcubacteria bacterium]|nr:MAG: hypothetical protein D6833_08535 [Candidatus Parcubacteria bacterium]